MSPQGINNLIQMTIKNDGEILIDFGGAVVVEQDADGERMTIRRSAPVDALVDVPNATLVATQKETSK